VKRRLAVILVADIVGFSRLMEIDEEGTAVRLQNCRRMAETEIARTEGRLFKAMGDAILAEFASPINALRCAVAIREGLASAGNDQDDPRAMRFGLHLADVLIDGDDLIGDGINLAARIQQTAAPGAIEISGALFEQIRRISPYSFEDCGERSFKNIGEPVHTYRLSGEIRRHPYQITPTKTEPNRTIRPYSLAVMPFQVPAGCEDQKFLAEGLAEELIFELGRFRKLFVVSRSATLSLEDDAEPRSVGQKLGVRYALAGSLRSFSDQTRLTMSLVETESGSIVWSDRSSKPLRELIDQLDELVSRIAATVLGRIEDADIAATRRLKPDSMTAFEFHLRGLELHRLGGITDSNKRKAMQWFQRAIDADPNFARPHAMLTCAWTGLPDFELGAGMRNVERALELDPNDPEAHRIIGSIKLGFGDYEAARLHHEKAMTLSPSDAYIKGRSASYYLFAGEPERALTLLDEAEALDAFLPVWCVEERVATLYALDRFEEAILIARALPFQTRRSRLYCAAALAALGELDRGREIISEARAATPDLSTRFIEQGEYYKDAGVKRRLIDRLEQVGLPRSMKADS